MGTGQSVEQTLRDQLPPALRHLAPEAARALGELLDQPPDGAAAPPAPEAGQDLGLAGGVLSFGPGSQLGDLAFRDVAGRDINHLTVVAPIIATAEVGGRLRQLGVVPGPAGAALQPAAAAAPARHPQVRSAPPRPVVGFRNREGPLAALERAAAELTPTWLCGPPGAGLSALLRKAASAPAARARPDGVALLDARGVWPAPGLDDLVQELFQQFYAAGYKPTRAEARVYLGDLEALVLLDHLPPLAAPELEALLDLAGRSLVIAAGPRPGLDTVATLAVGPLPRPDAVALCAEAAGLAPDDPCRTALEPLCAALDDQPLAVRLAGRLLRAGGPAVTPATLAGGLARLAGRGPALERIARCCLAVLTPLERAVVAALAHSRGAGLDPDALAAVAGAGAPAVAAAAERLAELGLVAGGHHIATESLRAALRAITPAGEVQARAAAFFLEAGLANSADPAWLEARRGNLMSAVETLLAAGRPAEAGALARAVQPGLLLSGRWDAWGQAIDWTLEAARGSGDRALEAWALHQRGTLDGLSGDRTGAARHLGEALRLRRQLGDSAGAEVTGSNMGQLGLAIPPPPPDGAGGAGLQSWPAAAANTMLAAVLGVALWAGVVAQPAAPAASVEPPAATVAPAPQDPPPAATAAPANRAPVPADDSLKLRAGETLLLPQADLLANDGDPDGDALRVLAVGASAAGGSVALTPEGNLTYAPPAGFTGQDSFGYTVGDEEASAGATVRVAVEAAPFLARNVAQALDEDQPFLFAVAGLVDGMAEGLTVAPLGATSARGGALAATAEGISYTPPADWSGADSFSYTVTDGRGESDEGMVTVQLRPVNDPPRPRDISLTMDLDRLVGRTEVWRDHDTIYDPARSPLPVIALSALVPPGVDSDDASERLSVRGPWATYACCAMIAGGQPPTAGSLVMNVQGTHLSYRPERGFTGVDRFIYTVCDPQLACAEAAIVVSHTYTDNGPPQAPSRAVMIANTPRPTLVELSADGDIGVDGGAGPVTVSACALASEQDARVLEADGYGCRYVPQAGFVGQDRFTYELTDWIGRTAVGVVEVTVLGGQPTETASPSPSASASPSPSPSPTASASPSPSPSPAPTDVPFIAVATPTATPTEAPPAPTETPTEAPPAPTETPTETPTAAPTGGATSSP